MGRQDGGCYFSGGRGQGLTIAPISGAWGRQPPSRNPHADPVRTQTLSDPTNPPTPADIAYHPNHLHHSHIIPMDPACPPDTLICFPNLSNLSLGPTWLNPSSPPCQSPVHHNLPSIWWSFLTGSNLPLTSLNVCVHSYTAKTKYTASYNGAADSSVQFHFQIAVIHLFVHIHRIKGFFCICTKIWLRYLLLAVLFQPLFKICHNH